MYYRRALEVLGIDDDDGLTRGTLRRIYLRKLKDHPPERDPDGFRELREAFELARGYVDDDVESSAAPGRVVVVDANGHTSTPKADVFVPSAASSSGGFASGVFAPPASASSSGTFGASSSGSFAASGRGSAMSGDVSDTSGADQPFVPFAAFDLSQPPDAPSDNAKFFAGGASNSNAPRDRSHELYNNAREELDDRPDTRDTEDTPDTYTTTNAKFFTPPRAEPPRAAPEPPPVEPPRATEPPRAAPEPPRILSEPPRSEPPRPPVDYAPLPPLSALREPEPPLPLSTLVPKLLELLEAGHVETARELEADWRASGDTDDYRQANPLIAARWSLLRELLAVAAELPVPVTKALARGLREGDLAKARPDLVSFRRSNQYQAEVANGRLSKRAPAIYRQIEGTLYVPPAPMPDFSPPVQKRSGSALGGVGIFAVIGMAVVRLMGSTSTSSHYDYDIKPIKMPDIDYSQLGKFDYHPPKYNPEDLWIPPPRPITLPDQSKETVWAALFESATTLQSRDDIASSEQQAAAGAFATDALEENCRKARKSLLKLDAAPPITNPEHKVYADEHLAAIHTWLDTVCPTGRKPKPPKQPT